MNDKTKTTAAKTRHDVLVVDNWTNNDVHEQANWTRVGVIGFSACIYLWHVYNWKHGKLLLGSRLGVSGAG